MTIHLIATGGTISSHFDGTKWTELDGHALVAELGDVPAAGPAGVTVHDVASGPSSSLGTADMARIARQVQQLLHEGASGVVVSHGTDTLELTAFALQLLLGTAAGRGPVVVTGAMRPHSHPQPDGPGNLRDAITVASSAAACCREVLVCLDGTVHAADRVVKRSTQSIDAFASPGAGPLGHVDGPQVHFEHPPGPARPAAAGLDVEVPLVTCYPDIAAAEVERVAGGRRGLVLEVFGDLNVPRQLWSPIHAATSDGVLVVLASRPFTPTVTNDGLELLGAVGAGGLTAQKARLATMAALATHTDLVDAAAFVRQCALVEPEPNRSATP